MIQCAKFNIIASAYLKRITLCPYVGTNTVVRLTMAGYSLVCLPTRLKIK